MNIIDSSHAVLKSKIFEIRAKNNNSSALLTVPNNVLYYFFIYSDCKSGKIYSCIFSPEKYPGAWMSCRLFSDGAKADFKSRFTLIDPGFTPDQIIAMHGTPLLEKFQLSAPVYHKIFNI